jgi:hypothetical protein
MIRNLRQNAWPLLGALLLAIATTSLVASQTGTPKYKKLLAEKGYASGWEDLDRVYPPVPDEENAGIYFTRETQYVQPPDNPRAEPAGDPAAEKVDRQYLPIQGDAELTKGETIPREVEEAIRTFVELKQNVLESAYQGAQLDRAWFAPAREDWQMQLNHYGPLRETARILYIDVLRHILDRDEEGAVRGVLAMLRVADALAQEPLIMSQIVRVALRDMAFEAMGEILSRLELSKEQLAELSRAIEAAPAFTLETIQHAVAGEAAFMGIFEDQLLAMAGEDDDEGNWLSRATGEVSASALFSAWTLLGQTSFSRIAMARILFWTIDTGDLPTQVAVNRRMDPWQPEFTGQLIIPGSREDPEPTISIRAFTAQMYANSFYSIYTFGVRAMTDAALAGTALAVEQYEREHSALPDSLDALTPKYLAEVPTDPFSGDPLRYRHTDTGYLVYSVGYDQEDDGGNKPPEKISLREDGDLLYEIHTINR